MFKSRIRTSFSKYSAAALAPVALLVMDIDQFKEVNDALGHDTGDAMLRQLVRRGSFGDFAGKVERRNESENAERLQFRAAPGQQH